MDNENISTLDELDELENSFENLQLDNDTKARDIIESSFGGKIQQDELEHTVEEEEEAEGLNSFSLIQQMKNLVNKINSKVERTENIDLLIDTFTYRIYDVTAAYTKTIETLKNKQALLANTNLPTETLTQRYNELERALQFQKEKHEQNLTSLNEGKIEKQEQYEENIISLDKLLENLKEKNDKLTRRITEGSGESYLSILETFEKEINGFKALQVAGWRNLHSQERIANLLELRGLKLTKSGEVLTNKGQSFTLREALVRGLLEGLEVDWHQYFPEAMESPSSSSASIISSLNRISDNDIAYLKETVGKPLTFALADITIKQPKDPIHYLAHWLFKYRYNSEVTAQQECDLLALNAERERLAAEKRHKELEDDARATIWDIIMTAENTAMRRELERIEKETEMLEEEEHSFLVDEMRDQLGVYGGPPVRKGSQL